jgi:nucleoid-associated protein YgaU
MDATHRAASVRQGLDQRVAAVLIAVLAVAAAVALALDLSGSGSAATRGQPRPAGAAVGSTGSSGPAVPRRSSAVVPATRHSHARHPASQHPASRHRKHASPSRAPQRHRRHRHFRRPLTYTIKPGDNLFNIAKWYHLHGYQRLYERNRKVIGDNPALIRPGQTITISGRGLWMGHRRMH